MVSPSSIYLPKIFKFLEKVINAILGPFAYFPHLIETKNPALWVLLVIVAVTLYAMCKYTGWGKRILGITLFAYISLLVPIVVLMVFSNSFFGCPYPWHHEVRGKCISRFR